MRMGGGEVWVQGGPGRERRSDGWIENIRAGNKGTLYLYIVLVSDNSTTYTLYAVKYPGRRTTMFPE